LAFSPTLEVDAEFCKNFDPAIKNITGTILLDSCNFVAGVADVVDVVDVICVVGVIGAEVSEK
jgi:hypothetical protein